MAKNYPLVCSQDPKHTEAWDLIEFCQFCPICGAALTIEFKACCKRWQALNANYCSECGRPLKEEAVKKEIAAGSVEVIPPVKKANGGKKKK